MNQTQMQEGNGRRGSGLNVLMFVARALAASVEVFLHDSKTFGERYLGLQAAAAVLIIFLFPAFYNREDPTPLYLFLGAYLVMCGAVRSSTVARRKKGKLGEHSYYCGRPRLLWRHPETTVKGVVEPLLVWIAGAFCLEPSPPLGGYLIVAGTGLLLSVQTTLAAERRRLLDMHDAYMEQRRIADEWRRMRRD